MTVPRLTLDDLAELEGRTLADLSDEERAAIWPRILEEAPEMARALERLATLGEDMRRMLLETAVEVSIGALAERAVAYLSSLPGRARHGRELLAEAATSASLARALAVAEARRRAREGEEEATKCARWIVSDEVEAADAIKALSARIRAHARQLLEAVADRDPAGTVETAAGPVPAWDAALADWMETRAPDAAERLRQDGARRVAESADPAPEWLAEWWDPDRVPRDPGLSDAERMLHASAALAAVVRAAWADALPKLRKLYRKRRRPFDVAAVPVDDTTRRTMALSVGGRIREAKGREFYYDEEARDGVIYYSKDPEGLRIKLPMIVGAGKDEVFARIAKKLGHTCVRDLLAIYALGFAARAAANELWYVWPQEILALLGRDPKDRHAQKELRQRLDYMGSIKLAIGDWYAEAVVAQWQTRARAWRVMLHPILWRGIRNESRALGRVWIPCPTKLLSAARGHNAPAALLPFALGPQWRQHALKARKRGATPPPCELAARVAPEDLAGTLNVQRRRVGALLDVGREAGLVGAWERDGGMLIVPPGDAVAGVLLKTEALPHMEPVPSVGADLQAWVDRVGASKAAQRLGVDRSTLYRWRRRYHSDNDPLPWEVRRTFLRAIWGWDPDA